MNLKKILIIENNTQHFNKIKFYLEDNYGQYIDVYPKDVNQNPVFENNNYLIGTLIEGEEENFKDTLNYYRDVSVYIIDVFLLNKIDRLGLLFAKYILENRVGNYRIIIISNNIINDEILRNDNVVFFSKFEKGIHFPRDLSKVVVNLINKMILSES